MQESGGGGTNRPIPNRNVTPPSPPRMTSDNRFKKFIADKSRQPPVRMIGIPISRPPDANEEFRRGERGQRPQATVIQIPKRIELPIIRKDDNRPSPSNPFGERQGRTPSALDRPMPKITPEIRAMAAPNVDFLDTDIVTPDYIKDVAHQDNDLAKRLARNYMDEYSRRLINGYTTKPLDNSTVDELNKLGERPTAEDFFKGVGNFIGGGLKLIQDVTRAPAKVYGYGVLSTGFEHQPKTIDPNKVKPGELDSLGVANVDLDKLPPYYSGQLKSGLSRNFAQDIGKSVREYHPDWLTMNPDPNPEKDKVYQGIVDKVFQERQDWDYYAKFFTPSDIPNTFFSAPGIRQAYAQGNPLTKDQESNILGTSGVAGLTASQKRVAFAKAMKDAGVPIGDEDATSFANGWSADTVNKYAALLKDKGVSLPDLVMQNTTWPELKRTLDLMRWPAEEQADIARSLGYKVTVEPDKPVFVETYNDYGVPQQEEKSREFVFNVHNPDMTVSLNDIRNKADVAMIDRNQFADTLAMKYTYAALADVKTVPFQDLAADLTLDPTNYGKLQLLWAPLGEVFKLGGKVAKEVGKGMYYSGAFMGDVGVGALKTIGNLIGKAKGVESKLIKPEDWRHVTDTAHYLASESAQSVVNKITNRAFFVTKSIMPTEYTKDGDTLMYWVENVLPNMQEAARTGDWSAFAREVPVGAGDYAASGLNAISRDLSRIAGDKDAFGRFADNLSKLFSDEIGADDVKVLQKLSENGDYAGVTSWLANKHIAHKIFSNIDPGEARHSLDASDLINHVTSAYRSGINVLTEKSMGVFDKEISPLALRINDTLSSLSRFWTNAVLTVRPGWNAINKVDNDARLLANGFDPSASAAAYEKELINLGMTPVQMREIIYGGNFLDEAIRLNVPVTPEMVEAVKYARKVTVSSEKKQFENLVELARRASASLERLPAETRRPMEDVVHKLSVEADKLVKGKGDVKAVRDAAAGVDNLANQMFGKTATVDTPLFRSRLENLKEYVNTLKGGDGFLISRIWDNFVRTGHAVHRDIEAAARMRVFAPTFIEKYHEALKTLSRDLPTFPDEAQLAERFANIVDPRARDEAIREATMAYSDVQVRLRGLVNEAALHPNKLPEAQAYLDELRSNPLSAARNFIYGNQPVVDGMTPAADILMQQIGDVMTSTFDGMSLADMSDKAKVSEALKVAYERSLNRIKTRDAAANLAARTNEIMKPSTKVPDAAVNWLQDQQITNLSDIETTIKRMEKIASDVEGVNQEFRDSFLELNHEPYLDTLDRIQRQLPGRAHRYDLMRDSFGEKFSGEARYGSETVQLVGGTMDKTRGVSVTLSDGRIVPADAIQIDDAQRAWYFKQYTKWEKAKPSGNNILTRSGIGNETGAGLKMRKPVYAATGEVGMVPPDVARSYVRKMEDDVVSHGGVIPTEYVDADGVKHALAYDDPQDFVNRFMSGSGLGYYKSKGDHFNLIAGIQRTADNWTYLARVSDATSMDELADVYINGKRVTDLYPKDANVAEVKKRIFSEKSAKVSVRYERNGMQVPPLTNDPSRGETLTDVTRRLWKDKVEGVYIETRGQWVPVFNPNAKAGERITFQKIGQDAELSSLRVPVDTGTSIPDEMGEALLKAQDAAAPVSDIGNEVESAMTRLDNLLKAAPERPPFKADSLVGGKDAMSTGKMQRLEDGSRGIEVFYADGSRDLVPVRDIQFLPPEKPAVTAADQSMEQVYADLGMKTPAQVETIKAIDPVSEFVKRHPRVNTRADLLDRVAFLREHGVPVQDEQVMAMADLLEAASVHMFHQEPDFLLKRVNLTPFAPDAGLYQRVNLSTPEFKKFFKGSVVTSDMAVAKPMQIAGSYRLSQEDIDRMIGELRDDASNGAYRDEYRQIYHQAIDRVVAQITPGMSAKEVDRIISGEGDNLVGWIARTHLNETTKIPKGPMVVYHGTPGPGFEAFDPSKFDSYGMYGPGIYMTDSPAIASGNGEDWIGYTGSREPGKEGIAGGAYPLYASIKRPFDIDKVYRTKEIEEIASRFPKDVRVALLGKLDVAHQDVAVEGSVIYKTLEMIGAKVDKSGIEWGDKAFVNNVLKNSGYDGITHIGGVVGGGEKHRVFIAFEPGQVKSAIANKGTWDIQNPNMLYQLAEEPQKMTRVGWLTDEERQQVFDQAMREGKAPAEEMAKAAEGYPASRGLVGAQGEPLFERGPQGEVLGAFKMIFDKQNGPFGMIHFGPGATRETVAHEFAHFIQGMAELPEQLFEGPEAMALRKEIRKQLDVVLEATGAPRLEYLKRGAERYRYVSYQNLYKVDREASNLLDDAKWEKFVEQARQSNERFAKHFTAYLATGKAPTKELSNVFKRFKEWLVEMFQARRASGERIPVEVKRIFDQWLAENPDWKRQLTKKGKEFLSPEKQAVFEQATKASGQLDDWRKAIDNLKVAYGGWNDSPAIDEFDRVANEAFAKLEGKSAAIITPGQEMGESYLESPAGVRLGELIDEIDQVDAGKYLLPTGKRPKPEGLAARRSQLVQEARDLGVNIKDDTKAVPEIMKFLDEVVGSETTGWSYAKEGTSLASYTDVQVINALTSEGNGYRFIKPDTLREIGHRYNSLSEDHKALVDKFMAGYSPERDELRYFEQGVMGVEKTGEAAQSVSEIMAPVWDAYGALLQDGKFHPKKLVDGEWVYPEGGAPLTTMGRLRAGKPTPPVAPKVGYLEQTVDDILAKEKGTPASLDELAALNAPNSTFVSPELVEVMKYHAGTKAYLDQWHAAMNAAVEGGFLPGKTMRGLGPEDMALTQQWLNDKYSQLSRAATSAQRAAEDKTKLVMMDFETTYNLDTLMQQGPALPSWARQLAGVRPLRVGGIVPFFKFPRENIESWVNTLGNHPALFHNVARYQEEGNIERKSLGLSSQLLPVWPVRVGDKVVSVSPFSFISLGQMIRPFNPYIDEDATGVDQAIGVAGQMGFSLGPTLRLALNALGLSQETMPILPQVQALVAPQNYQYIAEPLQWALGLKSVRDEFYVNRQIVFDGLADLNLATSEGSKQQILQDMANAIQTPDHPRRIAATDHYYAMRFDTSNTGYWTGLYPREISAGELDLKQYKTDIAQLRSAMVSAGLSPDQVDLIESYIQGDPRTESNRRLNSLYNADKSKAISDTETEAWADSVATAGKRAEYYGQRALIEAEFQQKYGFSGTAMTDADREDYNKRIFALNQKYEDVLTQRKLTKQPWQTNEDYHRGLSAMWLEYLNGTRPQFTNYKTYAEYQTAVDQWEKNLPKISRSMWATINAPLSALTTSNISSLPGYLDAVSNKQSIDLFRSKYDTVSEAIYSTLRDRYYSGYWDAVTGKTGAKRKLAEMEYNLKHPVPDEAAVQKWLADGIYSGRFTKQDVARELKAHSVADIRNSILSGKDLPHRQALEISDLLSNIPPGKAYFAFLDTLPSDVRKYYDAYQVDSYTPLDSPTKWSALYQYIVPALKGKFPEPTLSMVREWVVATNENDAMQALRDRRFPGIKAALDKYNAIDKADKTARRQFRSQHPEINLYYDWLYGDWQNSHPTWNKYYGSGGANVSTGATARPSRTSYVKGKVNRYSTGGRRYYGGGSYSYSPTTALSKAAQDAWNNFRSMAGPALYDKLISHWDTQAAFSSDELTLLQSLYKQYGFGAKDFNDWVENILPAMRSAMIPGTSIFDRQPYYAGERQPQFTPGYNWFGRGRNAA